MAKYAKLEQERKFLLHSMPAVVAASRRRIEDHYLIGTTLRLREVHTTDKATVYKLTQKLHNLDGLWITTVYLTYNEHLLFRNLPGYRLKKDRYRVPARDDIGIDVVEFQNGERLILAELESDDPGVMHSGLAIPEIDREVTSDPYYSGYLVAQRFDAQMPNHRVERTGGSLDPRHDS